MARYPALLLSILLALTSACGPSLAGIDDDLTITTRVKTALLNDRAIGGARIDVETFKGVVTLRAAAERGRAGQGGGDRWKSRRRQAGAVGGGDT